MQDGSCSFVCSFVVLMMAELEQRTRFQLGWWVGAGAGIRHVWCLIAPARGPGLLAPHCTSNGAVCLLKAWQVTSRGPRTAGRPAPGTLLSSRSFEGPESLGTTKKAWSGKYQRFDHSSADGQTLQMASRPVPAWRGAQPKCQLLTTGTPANVSQVTSVAKSRPEKLGSLF